MGESRIWAEISFQRVSQDLPWGNENYAKIIVQGEIMEYTAACVFKATSVADSMGITNVN